VRASDAIGDYGERLAERYLSGEGMQILDRRWRCRYGELDLVARDGECLVACEVKTRRSISAVPALESISAAKLARLRRLTAAWLADRGQGYTDIRIDLVAVTIPSRGAPVVEHLTGVG